MNLPVGNPIGTNMDLGKADFKQLLPKVKSTVDNGYIALDIMTNNGVEEGILLFQDGQIVSSEYIYFNKDKTVSGDEALPLVLNSSASSGVFEIYALPKESVEEARNSDPRSHLTKWPTDQDIIAMIPDTFSETIVEKEKIPLKIPEEKKVKKQIATSKEEVLKKYGIVQPDQKKLDALLSQVGEGVTGSGKKLNAIAGKD